MLRVGLTGGYATGKSFVAGELERLGCNLIYADKLGHDVLLPSGPGYAAAINEFGRGILGDDGLIDRRKLGQLVFARPDLLAKLNSIVHPGVYAMEAELIDRYTRQDPHAIVVTEAAILIETGRYKVFDRVIVTVCAPETQINRGMKRDRLTRQEVLDRIGRQMRLDEKRKYAHFLVDTDGPKAETLGQIETVFTQLKELAERT
jgi:dephospho-CoA kinase